MSAVETASHPYGVDRADWKESTCSRELCLTVVVLGATGDLAAKKTFPSLAALFYRGCAPAYVRLA
jgi:Glucose-6-phosphate dehydrogenase, NAD binding domain